MKVLTEAGLRMAFKNKFPETYSVSSRVLVTPSAREYLKEKKIALIIEEGDADVETKQERKDQVPPKYKCYYHGGFFEKKPEHMTQLHGNFLVNKDHPRIRLRGKLDSFQAEILEVQVFLDSLKEKKLLDDLGEVLVFVRNILRAEVLEEPFGECKILGLGEEELRKISHHPEKFFDVSHLLPEYSMGAVLIKLNTLRSAAREVEIVGVKAFTGENGEIKRNDILQALNRLSSCLYIMMCRWQGGHYK
ncbi:ethanolamine utilization cobalamin adenosyltransferase EutT [Clostridium aceticum]|uniref:Ethanolamine utilization cobalamin adenosyltransferase EutT n=1 Tax=Clostridium aceticum TaxID=84022 RepID=A0A0D8IHN1_9CLOT|nr:cobalamin adenosyltransferase [Clostridium aceticum]AKL93920.1 ethanolamine utilization cobalamin adenosyltransferase EutT [Clostridium aceticum]KJF28691.1 cobalamin adenosyltransferase [Clostridium aceticum]